MRNKILKSCRICSSKQLSKYLDLGKQPFSNSFLNYKNKKNINKNLLIKKSDIIIIASPHKAYKKLKIKKNKVLVDIWGLFEKKR